MTASDLIKSSMRVGGLIASGETPTNAELTDGLEALNMLLKSWGAHPNLIFARTEENFTLSIGTLAYTIGTSGAWNTVRPQRIESAFIRDSTGYDTLLAPISELQYNALIDKDIAGKPNRFFYDPQNPLGKVYLYPSPDAAYTLYLDSWKPITTLALLTTVVDFPPEWERALKYNLAVEFASEFGRTLPPEVAALAYESLQAVKKSIAFRLPSLQIGVPSNIEVE